MQLVVHILLGYRELRDAAHYQDDPLVQRVLGLKQLPDAATISRMLKEKCNGKRSTSCGDLPLLTDTGPLEVTFGSFAVSRITLDFDGSVQSTNSAVPKEVL